MAGIVEKRIREQGIELPALCALNLIAQLRVALDGDLDHREVSPLQ